MNAPGCLLDAGPLVAFLDKSDKYHEAAKNIFSQFTLPFRTCESVVSESCFLMRNIHPEGPADIIQVGLKGFYKIAFSLQDQISSVRALLEKYKDQSISLADACLIRMAEIYEEPRILTFDSDFKIYRWGGNKRFKILEE